MSINFAAGKTVYETMIDNFTKTVSHQVVTQTEDNMSGSEELTWATAVDLSCAFYRRGDNWIFQKEGLFEDADAIMLVKTSATVVKNDKITYDGVVYIVDHVVPRGLNGTNFYQAVELFQYQA